MVAVHVLTLRHCCQLAERIVLVCGGWAAIQMLCCAAAKGIIQICLCIFAVAVCCQLSEHVIHIASAAGIHWCI